MAGQQWLGGLTRVLDLTVDLSLDQLPYLHGPGLHDLLMEDREREKNI